VRVRDDITIEDLEGYGFNCIDEMEDVGYIWNEEANISVNMVDRSVYVYGFDEEDYQDLSVLYRMFKDGILEEIVK
jgi:hypothetical protein